MAADYLWTYRNVLLLTCIGLWYICLSQFIQKRDPKYLEVKEETAWSMDRFNEYINENVSPNKDLPQDWVYGHLDVSYILPVNLCSIFNLITVIL